MINGIENQIEAAHERDLRAETEWKEPDFEDVSDFSLTLGKMIGFLSRKEIEEYFISRGCSDMCIQFTKDSLNHLAGISAYRRKHS